MSTIEERPNRWPWPPLIYGLAIVAAIVAGRYAPRPLSDIFQSNPVRMAGAALALLGLALDIWAIVTLQRGRTAVLPNQGATNLITHGPFAWSRNPIYLGNTLVMLGAGLWLSNVWFIAGAVMAVVPVRKLAIEREEAHLAARFGDAWTSYCQRVRRWI